MIHVGNIKKVGLGHLSVQLLLVMGTIEKKIEILDCWN